MMHEQTKTVTTFTLVNSCQSVHAAVFFPLKVQVHKNILTKEKNKRRITSTAQKTMIAP